jgi:hypothetical protein
LGGSVPHTVRRDGHGAMPSARKSGFAAGLETASAKAGKRSREATVPQGTGTARTGPGRVRRWR